MRQLQNIMNKGVRKNENQQTRMKKNTVIGEIIEFVLSFY